MNPIKKLSICGLLVILLSSFSVTKENTKELLWVQNIVDKLNVTEYFMTTDPDQNLIITGFFNNTAQFGDKKIVAVGGYDIFVAKYSHDGKLLWLQQAGSDQIDIAKIVKTDNVGNIYITGYISGIAFFNEYLVKPNGQYDIFTAKYSSEGKLLWVKCKGDQVVCETTRSKRNKLYY